MAGAVDYIVWFARNKPSVRYRKLYWRKSIGGVGTGEYQYIGQKNGVDRRLQIADVIDGEVSAEVGRVYSSDNLTSQRPPGSFPVFHQGRNFESGAGFWKTGEEQFPRLLKADRVIPTGSTLKYRRYLDGLIAMEIANYWSDTSSDASKTDPKIYIVQTAARVIERCMLMVTDPGDLALDPTCGSGTTAFVAEHWGRRWITIDTSRVALALARTRLMAARHPAFLIRDTPEGAAKNAELTSVPAEEGPFQGDIRQGFVLERVPHVTLKCIANNSEIDVIHAAWQPKLDAARAAWNAAQGTTHEE